MTLSDPYAYYFDEDMKIVNELIKSHRFFVRESQHYVLENWSEYVPISLDKIKNYYLRYPKAYLKFMYYSLKDLL